MKITSKDIKLALMKYFRFNRQWLCATECLNMDVVAITDKDIHEVEVKISKHDLWQGEAKKDKHKESLTVTDYPVTHRLYKPTKFSVCVPKSLQEEAEKWVKEVNPKYGVAIYQEQWDKPFWVRTAKRLFEPKDIEPLKEAIMKRICCEKIVMMEKLL